MRTFVIELLAETVELALLGLQVAGRWFRGLGLEGLVHALVPAVLLRFAGLDEVRQDAESHYQADRLESLASVLVANGTPLSVRMRFGNPNSLNSRVNTGFASFTAVVSSPWQPSRYRL